MKKPNTLIRSRVSGTFNHSSQYYKATVVGVKKDQPYNFNAEMPVHVACLRKSTIDSKFETQTKTLRVDRSVYRKLHRLSNELSQLLEEYEAPYYAKFDVLDLVKKMFKSSTSFRSLRLLHISIEIGDLKPEPIDELPDSDKNCAICLDDFSTGANLPCGHVFDADCILRWLNVQFNCPLCRFELKKIHVEDIRRQLHQ